jgi:inosine/xanthosine triphosphate pyrophosphatase family protein
MPGFSAAARVSRLKLFGGSWANRYLKKKKQKKIGRTKVLKRDKNENRSGDVVVMN